jgi:hypothetical protein
MRTLGQRETRGTGQPHGRKSRDEGEDDMQRRWLIGTLAAGALLAGSGMAATAPRAQAQAYDCVGEFGTSAGCGELRFNMSPAPDTMPPAPILANPGLPATVAAQPGAADTSQAGPAEESQPAGHE